MDRFIATQAVTIRVIPKGLKSNMDRFIAMNVCEHTLFDKV